MDISHDAVVGFAKSFGLFYLIAHVGRGGDLRLLALARQALRPGGQEHPGRRGRPMSVKERDPLTGHQTTGHEWNGITELNTRVPPAVWWFIVVTHVWALIVWILMPSWPLIWTYTGGFSASTSRSRSRSRCARRARRARPGPTHRRELPIAEIRADPELMARGERDRARALRRQLRRLPRRERRRRPGLPEPRRRRLALGRRRRHDPGDAARRHQRRSTPRPGSRRCWPSAATGSSTRDEIRTVAAYVQSLSGSRRAARTTLAARRRALRRRTAPPATARTAAAAPSSARPTSPTRSGSTAATTRASSTRSTTAGRAGCRRGRTG